MSTVIFTYIDLVKRNALYERLYYIHIPIIVVKAIDLHGQSFINIILWCQPVYSVLNCVIITMGSRLCCNTLFKKKHEKMMTLLMNHMCKISPTLK